VKNEDDSPPREEGRLRHQENSGEAHLRAADGVVVHTETWLVSDSGLTHTFSPLHSTAGMGSSFRAL